MIGKALCAPLFGSLLLEVDDTNNNSLDVFNFY